MEETKSRLREIDIEDLLQREFEPREGIVVPWLAKGELCLLYAKRGVGKSYFCMWLAAHIALGYKFCGWDTVRKRVLYVDGEMGLAGSKNRFKGIFQALGRAPSKEYMRLVSYPEDGAFPNLSLQHNQELLETTALDFDVIVVDNLLTVAGNIGPRDDEFKIWGRMQPWFIKLREMGKTVILIHHSAKSGAQSGTMMKENICDVVIQLSEQKLEDHSGCSFVIESTKERNFVRGDSPARLCKLYRDPVKWAWQFLHEAKAEFVLRKIKQGWSHADISSYLCMSKAEVKDLEKLATGEDVVDKEDKRETVQEAIDWNTF